MMVDVMLHEDHWSILVATALAEIKEDHVIDASWIKPDTVKSGSVCLLGDTAPRSESRLS